MFSFLYFIILIFDIVNIPKKWFFNKVSFLADMLYIKTILAFLTFAFIVYRRSRIMLTYSFQNRGNCPKYEYLYRCIKEDILSGRIPSDAQLPSKRALAEHLGIGVITVEAAYSQLLDEGYIFSRARSGFYVNQLQLPTSHPAVDKPAQDKPRFSEPSSPPAQTPTDHRHTVDFPFASFLHIVREVLNDYRDRLPLRPPNAGTEELRSAISSYLLRYRGMSAAPEQIIIGSGSEYLYGLVAQLFDRRMIYAIEGQSYEKIRLVYSAYARPYELLPMDSCGVSSEGLRNSQAGVLHVTPFHSYPTGITAPAAKRYEYLAWAEARNAFIVEDDFESEFAVQKKPLETMYAMDHTGSVIYLNTFTKSLAPSMRVGYMVLPERLLPAYREKLGFYSCTVPSLDQYVLAEYISRGYLEKRLNRIRRQLRQNSPESC